MPDPVPLFDPAAWCERWLKHGGRIDWQGHAVRPLAASFPFDALEFRQLRLRQMHRQLAPHHRDAIRAFVRHDPRWRTLSAVRCDWHSGYGRA